jgi:hypothetical protein
VGNEEVSRVKDERDILQTINRRWANWIGHIMRRNCRLIHVIEGEKEVRIQLTVKWGRRRKQLQDDIKKTRGHCKLKEEALDHTLWRTRFGKVYGQITEWMTLKREKASYSETSVTHHQSSECHISEDYFINSPVRKLQHTSLNKFVSVTLPAVHYPQRTRISARKMDGKIRAETNSKQNPPSPVRPDR